MIESAMTVRLLAGANFCSSSALHHYRPSWSSDEVTGMHAISRQLLRSGCFNVARRNFRRFNSDSIPRRRNFNKNRTQATAEYLGSASDPIKQNERSNYHPFEDVAEALSEKDGEAILTAAETTRTVIEVNSKATIMLTSFVNDDVHENIVWPDLPYVTDEHGNVYFQVKNDEDILQTITSDNNFVQVIIGFDTTEMMKEMELSESGPSELDLGIDGLEDEDSDVEDGGDDEDDDEDDGDYEEDWVAVLEDDQEDSDESLGDWAKLETMRFSHPVHFAQTLAEVASNDPVDWMEQPPAGLSIQGLIRPVLIEEYSYIESLLSGHQAEEVVEEKLEDADLINGDRHGLASSEENSNVAEESESDGVPRNGASFYKLEMVNIELITSNGHKSSVEVEDFKKAQPDAIAHSAAKIISRLKAGGEKTEQALKSLCWRCKGLQVEEATVISIDSLGFDLRVCSETQVQTLRFAFFTRATSEYSAERQLNGLLYPRNNQQSSKKRPTHQNEF